MRPLPGYSQDGGRPTPAPQWEKHPVAEDRSSDALRKIRSEDLRDIARDESSERQTIIVELDLPVPQIIPPSRFRSLAGDRQMFMSASKKDDSDAIIDKARRRLTEMLGREPKFLRSSHSFIVDADGAQIREIAELPSVHAIWPNRQL